MTPSAVRALLLGYGAWGGWLAALWAANARLVSFVPHPAPAGIPSYCYRIGYPKQQDYFWYAAAVAAAVAGGAAALLARGILRRAGWRGREGRWALPLGGLCLAGATALGVRGVHGGPSPVLVGALALAGLLLPWLDRRWTLLAPAAPEPDEIAPGPPPSRRWWIPLSAVVAALWVWDPCIRFRVLDGVHEGFLLLYVQSHLAGDTPGVRVNTVYGPLYIHSLIWWMKAFGMNVLAARWYFTAAQVLGTAVHLALVRAVCGSWPAVLAGAWLMLTTTTAPDIQYGWANALRTALPLLALAALWRAALRGAPAAAAGAGALCGGALLYSQEHGLACAAGSAVLLAVARHRGGAAGGLRVAGAWAGGAALGVAALLLLTFGRETGAALARSASGHFAVSRLLGYGAHPFPVLPPVWEFRYLGETIAVAALWWPGLLAGAAGLWLATAGEAARRGRGLFAAGLTVLALLAQVPAVVRPLGQVEGAAAPAILLAALALDHAWRRGLRPAAAAAALVMGLYGLGRIAPYQVNFQAKTGCLTISHLHPPATVARLGGVEIGAQQDAAIANFIGGLRALCPPDKRLYFGAAGLEHMAFLADRAGLPPFPGVSEAATAAERAELLAALERERPPVALLKEHGLFLPFAEEHPEELAYIRAHYTLQATVGDVKVYVRKRP